MWCSFYLRRCTDGVFNERSGRQYVGVVRDVFRDLVCYRSQEFTEELKVKKKERKKKTVISLFGLFYNSLIMTLRAGILGNPQK